MKEMDIKYDDDVSTSDTGERNARELCAQSWGRKRQKCDGCTESVSSRALIGFNSWKCLGPKEATRQNGKTRGL